ncbi:BRO family protein [Thauera butanivorans]|uniref:BRO family protein n=1 Tax=Thauera butanivorans TaxID=86174 RepID=UPI0009FE41BE|nr:BRO family protein [Thauera butanivorans]
MAAQSLAVFQFHTHAVRVFPTDDGQSFIAVAADVARALGFQDARDMTRCVDDEDKGSAEVPTPGGTQRMLTVNESGIYAATFRSRKDSAKAFRRWITAEVLPSIRRTGAYGQPAMPASLDLAREIGALRDELRTQSGMILDLYRKLDAARRGHIAAQRGQLAALREVAAVRNAQHAQAVQDGIDAVLRMEAEGMPRDEIARATGKTRNYIRQIVFRARNGRGGEHGPADPAGQGELALEG